MQDVSNGVERTRAWPRKRGSSLAEKTKAQMEWFRQAQWATKYMDPKQMLTFMEATKGTPLLPRDIATMMMAGRWLRVILPDGRILTSVQSQNDVSQSLDTLGDQLGMTLVRQTEGWRATAPFVASRVGARLRRNTNLAVPNGGAGVVIPWQVEQLDQANFWNISAPTEIVIPFSGWYNASISIARALTPATAMDLQFFLNGAFIQGQSGYYPASIGAYRIGMQVLRNFVAGDKLTFRYLSYGAASTMVDAELNIVGNA